jgi:hypothetical protein
MNRTVAVRRTVAKRTHPFDLEAGELHLVSSTPQAEDIPAARESRASRSLFPQQQTKLLERQRHLTFRWSFLLLLLLPLIMMTQTDTQTSAAATRVTRHWTSEEDAKLTSAFANTSKIKWGKEYKINWDAVAALVPSRTKKQCRKRWREALDPNIDPTTARASKWTAVEDGKLKDAVHTHGGKDWAAIAAWVPGRTKRQCRQRWHDGLAVNINWSEDEDKNLEDSVKTHRGKDWAAIAALIPGRTKKQCHARWRGTLKPNID